MTLQDPLSGFSADEIGLFQGDALPGDTGPQDADVSGQETETPTEPNFEERIRAREAEAEEKLRAAEEKERSLVQTERTQERINTMGGHIRSFYAQKYNEYYQQYSPEYGDEGARAWAESLSRKDAEGAVAQVRWKMAMERLIAREEGVPEEILHGQWTESTMRERAKNYKATGGADKAKVNQLERELAELREQLHKGVVRPANYNDSGSSRPGNDSYQDLLKSGKPLPPSSEIDRITSRYLQG